MVGGYRTIRDNGPAHWRVILGDTPSIITGNINGCPVRFVDTMNYVHSPLSTIGESVGLPKLPMPAFTAADEDWFAYCQRDVEIIEAFILRMRTYLQENDCGTWGKTAAQCSMNLYKHRHMHHKIVIDADDETTELERASYYGGELTCFKIGDVAGPVFQLDVNSLYPHVMATQLFPCRHIVTVTGQSLDWLKARLPKYGAIAECLCVTYDKTLPKRYSDKTYYVKGVFRTVLAGIELSNAIANGNVLLLGRVALYETKDLFSSFVAELWEQRVEARAKGDAAWGMFVKMLVTSLSGKWAQRSPRYHERPGHYTPILWGPYYVYDVLAERYKEYRAIAGVCQELIRHDENWASFPAISAFITAAGREHMRRLSNIVDVGGCFYQDNDSLAVDEEGLDRLLLAGEVSVGGLGKLKLVRRAENMTIYGPKHYAMDSVVVCGSRAASARQTGPETWEQWDFTDAEGMLRFQELQEMIQTKVVKHTYGRYTKGLVLPSGRTRPFEVYSF